jgi:hypothetical protein
MMSGLGQGLGAGAVRDRLFRHGFSRIKAPGFEGRRLLTDLRAGRYRVGLSATATQRRTIAPMTGNCLVAA